MRFEDDHRGFLILIAQSISVILIWMIFHVFVGIFLGYGFFEERPDWKNYIYYAVLLVSLYFLIRYIRKKWRI